MIVATVVIARGVIIHPSLRGEGTGPLINSESCFCCVMGLLIVCVRGWCGRDIATRTARSYKRHHPVTCAELGIGTRVARWSCSPDKDGRVDLLTWCIVGLVAGVLASLVMGGTGYGIIGDIIIGIIGAFVGGWLFRTLGTSSPFGGLGGVIFVAFIGAVVLLFLLRLLRRGTTA